MFFANTHLHLCYYYRYWGVIDWAVPKILKLRNWETIWFYEVWPKISKLRSRRLSFLLAFCFSSLVDRHRSTILRIFVTKSIIGSTKFLACRYTSFYLYFRNHRTYISTSMKFFAKRNLSKLKNVFKIFKNFAFSKKTLRNMQRLFKKITQVCSQNIYWSQWNADLNYGVSILWNSVFINFVFINISSWVNDLHTIPHMFYSGIAILRENRNGRI